MNVPDPTPAQAAVIQLRAGNYLIAAPPGSGKTETIARRIASVLEETPNESFKLLALTFTKKAASTMKARVREQTGTDSTRVTVSTYHAFCLDILRHYGKAVGVPSEPTIYDSEHDRSEALLRGLEAEGLVSRNTAPDRNMLRDLLEQISALKRNLKPPDGVPADAVLGSVPLADAYRAYDEVLQRQSALDFDHVLVKTYELLIQQPRVARHYRTIYRYVMVDEAQDTNRAQYEILKALFGVDHGHVLMVADPAQSIYGFSGANLKFLDDFVADFSAERRPLDENFRCAREIILVANRLLPSERENLHSGIEGEVSVRCFADEDEEARGSLDWVRNLLTTGLPADCYRAGESASVKSEEIAILGRNRLHLRAVIEVLNTAPEIPYYFSAGSRGVFDSELYQLALATLRLLASPTDIVLRLSLLGQLNIRDDAAGSAPAEISVSDFLAEASDGIKAGPARDLLASLGRWSVAPSVGTLMDQLVQWMPAEEADAPELGELWVSDGAELSERWRIYTNTVEERQRSWQDWVVRLADEPRNDPPGVRIFTVHASKGLEFKCVCVVGMNEGSFPDFRSTKRDADLAGERRLAYVAATRASRMLRFSRPAKRETRYGPRLQEASRFLQEMGLNESQGTVSTG